MRLSFYTVGHSNRSIEEFVALLREVPIGRVVDVRKMPMSRANPQFNGDTLRDTLAEHQMSYEHMPALGGLRRKVPDVSPETNGFWENRSFHNYADYALTASFQDSLDDLIREGRERRCAVMCSEAVWWRCHRRLIADHLIARGETVIHIMARGRLEPARLTPGARIRPDGAVVYPAEAVHPDD
jgi:uncharacterized protein (DUF488 family)